FFSVAAGAASASECIVEVKRETTRPAASTLRSQQRRFDFFRDRYNEERPHEGIADQIPASLWKPSSRLYPDRIVAPEYPAHMEIRRVSNCGTFRPTTRSPSSAMLCATRTSASKKSTTGSGISS